MTPSTHASNSRRRSTCEIASPGIRPSPNMGIGDPHLGPQPVDDAHAQLVGAGIVGAEILDPVAQPPHERCVRSPCVPARGWRRFEHQSCEVEAVCHPVVTARLPVLKRQPNGVFLPKQRGDGGTECIDVLLLPCNDPGASSSWNDHIFSSDIVDVCRFGIALSSARAAPWSRRRIMRRGIRRRS